MSADDIVAAAIHAFHPRMAIACSFQQEEAVILDMAFAVRPDVRVFALDTGFLFPETYETWRAYEERYGITIEAYQAGLDHMRKHADRYPEDYYGIR
jgi:phosphoadenosine phosphosulfate reductase